MLFGVIIKMFKLVGLITAILISPVFADEQVSGTGFFIADNGYVATNFHVIDGCRDLKVRYHSKDYMAAVTIKDEKNDLAILKLNDFNEAVPKISINTRPQLGENLYVYGFPLSGILSDTGNFTTGSVTSLQGIANDSSAIQLSAPIQPGNSGGAVLDDKGNVIGIVRSRLKAEAQNVNFAIKVQLLDALSQSVGITMDNSPKNLTSTPVEIAKISQGVSVFVSCFLKPNSDAVKNGNPKEQPKDLLYFDTVYGRVIVNLFVKNAPQNIAQLKKLALRGFYDGTVFHRVISGFMIQGGDPTGTGMGGSDLPNVRGEFSNIPFKRGIMAMARAQEPDTANSQFFIMLADTPSLNGKYSVVGEVISGMNILDMIKKGDPNKNGLVERPDKILRMGLGN